MPRKNSASTINGAARLDPARVRVAAQPIIWSSDDFSELGGDIPLERCLSEMKAAGYAGTELGHKFPTEPAALKNTLSGHGLALASGWHSTYLASKPLAEERRDFAAHLNKLGALGCRVAIAAECTSRTYSDPKAPLGRGSCSGVLDAAAWTRMSRGLDELAAMAEDKGLSLAYHPHMGTVVESRSEIGRLMDAARKIKLLADCGHFTFAGADPLEIFRTYASRIAHVHLKDVRLDVMERAVAKRLSFRDAVVAGVFTVPGDGGVDFAPLFDALASARYEGWLVVEAEQDPAKAPPLEYARRAREYILRSTGL